MSVILVTVPNLILLRDNLYIQICATVILTYSVPITMTRQFDKQTLFLKMYPYILSIDRIIYIISYYTN